MKSGYYVKNSAATALAAATARTVLAVLAPSTFGCDLKKWRLSFDGISAAAVPVYWELCTLTAASNSTVGTNNTTETANIVQAYGRSITTGFVAFSSSVATFEPTVLTAIDSGLLTPNGGAILYDFPLGDTPDSPVSQGFAIRCTAPAVVNVRAGLWFERC